MYKNRNTSSNAVVMFQSVENIKLYIRIFSSAGILSKLFRLGFWAFELVHIVMQGIYFVIDVFTNNRTLLEYFRGSTDGTMRLTGPEHSSSASSSIDLSTALISITDCF